MKTKPIDEDDLRAVTPVASPVDSLEREPIAVAAALPLLQTSTDSLEPSYERIEESQAQRDSDASSLAEYEVSYPIIRQCKTYESIKTGLCFKRRAARRYIDWPAQAINTDSFHNTVRLRDGTVNSV